jgi:hypothetical protein
VLAAAVADSGVTSTPELRPFCLYLIFKCSEESLSEREAPEDILGNIPVTPCPSDIRKKGGSASRLNIFYSYFFKYYFAFSLYETNVCRCPMNKQPNPLSSEKGSTNQSLLWKIDSSCPMAASPDSQAVAHFLYVTFF